MGNVYPLDTERNLVLYRSGTDLYIRTTSGENMMRAVMLCSDHRDGLSDTVYNGTVYYTYRSTQNDIIVRSITDLQNIYRIASQEVPDCIGPHLVSFQEELLLFYMVKSPLNNAHYIKAVFPLDPQRRINLPETPIAKGTAPGILVTSERLFVCLGTTDGQLLFSLGPDFLPTIHPLDTSGIEAELRCQEKRCQETIKELDAARQELALAESRHEALKARTEKLERENAQKQSELEANVREHGRMIESIRAQYDELMGTATRYREEAAKWHQIACSRDTKPLPGERLLMDEW